MMFRWQPNSCLCDANSLLAVAAAGSFDRDDAELVAWSVVGLASIHRNITTTSTIASHLTIALHQAPDQGPGFITRNQKSNTTPPHFGAAKMVQTTGMLGEGRHIHERTMETQDA